MSDRMTMMRRVWPGAAALVLAWLALAPLAGRVSAAAGNNLAPTPVFLPLAPRLARARIPVYLPAWLPAFPQRVYPIASTYRGGMGYVVALSTQRQGGGDASLVFSLDSHRGGPATAGRAVVLRPGVIAHLDPHTGGNQGLTLSWAVGPYSYELGYLPTEGDLIRAARSLVRVPLPGEGRGVRYAGIP